MAVLYKMIDSRSNLVSLQGFFFCLMSEPWKLTLGSVQQVKLHLAINKTIQEDTATQILLSVIVLFGQCHICILNNRISLVVGD